VNALSGRITEREYAQILQLECRANSMNKEIERWETEAEGIGDPTPTCWDVICKAPTPEGLCRQLSSSLSVLSSSVQE
jgi:hypothetical protein